MNIGMLWFDNDKKTDLPTKVTRAVKYYQDKYDQSPNICFVHPCMIVASPNIGKSQDVEIRTSNTILPHHFWIGVDHPQDGEKSS